uniref:TonB family protein n=1 Tax=Rhodopseudomonas palustris (strain BisA53) TaxID=316055 RepID=Q07KY3_RHOP5
MSSEEFNDRRSVEPQMPARPTAHWNDDDPDAWSSRQLLGLIIAPGLVTMLLVGGIYWIRLQLPAGSAGHQQAAIMQVHLLPSPAPPTVPVLATSQSLTENVVSSADEPLAESNRPNSDVRRTAALARAFEPAELPPTSVAAMPAQVVNGPPNVAAIKFQQALLQHVARYQRYPSTGVGRRLEGKVDAQFSMARDGTVLGAWVKTSSGQQLLDKEALDTIRRAQPLPPIPPGLPDRLNIHVQLVFEPA